MQSRLSGIALRYDLSCQIDHDKSFFCLIRYNIPIIKRVSTIPVAADAPTIAAVLSVDFEGIGSDVVVAIQKL